MNLLQAWMIVGVPTLAVVLGLFAGRSPIRAGAGYALLLGLIGVFSAVPGGGLSAAAVGLLAAFFVATGRGSRVDTEYREHHELRDRYTRSPAS